ncbi:nonsense-mediated mRNA decay factor SMG8-like, partial [Saccoglossus kowalevskii]|uniref:Nonsense-mediated mRNA decay factor SMG8 n=1 Tax=Saccoglossus kowalevskii TaxID=10224 RepID=A0ABM0MUI6_SACKO
ELKATGQICVVGVFGKSRYGHRSKTNIVNKLLGRNVFPVYFHDDNNFDDSDDKSCKLEAYFDEKSQVLFLHLISVADSAVLFQMCRDLDEDLSDAEAHKLWQDAEHKHAKTLLFMFSVCHIMVMVHPNSTFDLHYIRLFKALENIRQKVLPLINDKMASLSVNTEWQNSGRLCTPRLLFVGQQVSANCLFTVPANQAYVHIETGKDTNDPVSTVLGQLKKHTLYSSEPGILRNYQASHHGRRTITNLHVSRSQPNSKDAESLKEFLWQHIDLVLNGKGFDDAISRSVVSHVHFE